ncbi:PIR Superfamily Protein [Plasmodium ovale curtisi]|uniref:PIR Superfamily Protein n=1 Tax=Plasmodium ovale curtisi TaxID=864141 RepID=A0A1A8XDR6_PLAOA|nr:PIR Superfamily Protein [Plasmodium ovale curtisi]SBT02466.1 PIR Superfamily Protein [Plasmodium ovale curtisi]
MESDDTTYYDIGCKYLFYWLYTHVKSNEKAFINTLNLYKQLYRIYNEQHNAFGIFNKYIDIMNEHTIDKLVKITDIKKHNRSIKNIKKCKGVKYLLSPVEKSDIVAFDPWIHRLIGKNKNILEYINEETNHSLNTYEIRDDNSNMPNYNIAYNSS